MVKPTEEDQQNVDIESETTPTNKEATPTPPIPSSEPLPKSTVASPKSEKKEEQEPSRATTTTEPTTSTVNDDQKQTKPASSDTKKEVTVLTTNSKGLHTVFIHKLYNMLEDEELKHLIWWSNSNESFLITPGEEFSKALSQYFKHTNVASFIRQLNMYGFHKVSDGNPSTSNEPSSEIPVWEFRHSSGNFRKGDINSLKSIKRRSSKHSSKSVNNSQQGIDSASVSDNEFSERSNSVSDLAGLNDSFASNNNNNMNPILNVRLAELGHSLAALRHEHARLQLRYDTAIDDLRKTNMDMVYLLDLVQKLIRSQSSNHELSPSRTQIISPKATTTLQTPTEDDLSSPGSNSKPIQSQLNQPNQPNPPYSLQEVESDIARFRASIIQRAASKDLEQYPVGFAPSYQMNQIPKPSNATPNQQPNQSEPVPYPYPYPYAQQPNQMQQPPQQMVPSYVIQQQGLPQMVHDPFHSDRKSSTSSSKRHMSVLFDPLQPSNQGLSPASTSINRNSLSALTSNPETNIASPIPSNSPYFGDYQSIRTHTPDQQTYSQFRQVPVSRDQRPGSFPNLVSNLRPSNDVFFRKMPNDSPDYERRDSNNPPRSIPRSGEEINQHYHPQPIHGNTNVAPAIVNRRQSLSPGAADVNYTKSLGNNVNSGVYALLNPERRDSITSNVPPAKKIKR